MHEMPSWIQFLGLNRVLLCTIEDNIYVQIEWKDPKNYRILGIYIVRKKADGTKYLLSMHHDFHGELFDGEVLSSVYRIEPLMEQLIEVAFNEAFESHTTEEGKYKMAMVMHLGPIDALPFEVFTERQ